MMIYKTKKLEFTTVIIYEKDNGTTISFGESLDNSDYRQFLDDLNEFGTEIVDGEIPESTLTHASQKKFQQQLNAYGQAVARLAQYILSEGRTEVKAMRPNGQQSFNPETLEYEDVLIEMVMQSAIDPLPATVQIWEGYPEPVQVTVPNPAIVQDESQRAAAQAIVDATPQEVKDAA
jgi:hypothetical protein